jgi:hypothetical protein
VIKEGVLFKLSMRINQDTVKVIKSYDRDLTFKLDQKNFKLQEIVIGKKIFEPKTFDGVEANTFLKRFSIKNNLLYFDDTEIGLWHNNNEYSPRIDTETINLQIDTGKN